MSKNDINNKEWIKVGQLVEPADGSNYIGRIISVSVEDDTVIHEDVITGKQWEKSYFGFFCRYMPYDESAYRYKHIIAYCTHCEADVIKCKTCRNNCCNGGYGEVNDQVCPDCPEAYKENDILWGMVDDNEPI